MHLCMLKFSKKWFAKYIVWFWLGPSTNHVDSMERGGLNFQKVIHMVYRWPLICMYNVYLSRSKFWKCISNSFTYLISFLLISHFEENLLRSYWATSYRLLLVGDYCADPFIYIGISLSIFLCSYGTLCTLSLSLNISLEFWGGCFCSFQTNIPLWPLFCNMFCWGHFLLGNILDRWLLFLKKYLISLEYLLPTLMKRQEFIIYNM